MSRVCVIGDSHIAAIKKGWTLIETEFPGLELDFFGGPGNHMRDLGVSEAELVAKTDTLRRLFEKTSGGASSISGGYDRYLLCGLGLSMVRMLLLSRDYRAESFRRDNRIPISDDCFAEALRGSLRKSLIYETLEKVRQISAAPAMLVPTPMHSEKEPVGMWRRTARSGDAAVTVRFFNLACEDLAQECKAGFRPQPAETIGDDGFATREIFGRDPARIAVPDAEEDRSHMNGEYGALVLRDVLLAFTGGAAANRKAAPRKRKAASAAPN